MVRDREQQAIRAVPPRCPGKLRLSSGAVIGICHRLKNHDGQHGNEKFSWSDGENPVTGFSPGPTAKTILRG